MLKKIRVSISLIIFTLLTLYFIDFASITSNALVLLAKIQLVPAILSASFVTVAVLIILTLLFGRIYCSSICPMGIYQDIVAKISKRIGGKKKRYTYSKAKTALRWIALAVFILALLFGITVVAGLLEPYSVFGRIASNLLRPIYLAGNNLLAYIFSSFDNYIFYKVEITIISISSFIIALSTLLGIGYLAWRHGRTFCNTLCPVGTVLGFISRFSLFKVRINHDSCNNCGLCAMRCKASCIDSANSRIDHSRCVDCFNCLDSCAKGSLTYSLPTKQEKEQIKKSDIGKRQFLFSSLTLAASIPTLLYGKEKKKEINRNIRTRQTPICPPGALSEDHLLSKCTSCHLCISKCPSNVIKPAFLEYGLGGMMQPMMTYEKGFCNYNCTICTEVCPTNALTNLSMEQKHMTQLGQVVFIEDICITVTDGTNCGACAEHCPTQAVTMIPYGDGLTIPEIKPEICVGCGGCEFICPVRPHRAIFVEGHTVQRQREEFETGEKEEVEIDGFGF